MAHHCKHFSSVSGGRLTLLPPVQILPQEMARNGALPYPQFNISTYTHLASTSQMNHGCLKLYHFFAPEVGKDPK